MGKMTDIMQPLLPGWTEGKATDQEACLLNINTDDVVYRHEDGKIQLERPSRGKNVPDSKPPPGPSRARDKVPKVEVTAPIMTGGTSCTSPPSNVRRRLTSAEVVLARLKTLSTSRSPK